MQLFKGHWQLLMLVCAIFLLWSTPVMAPFKILIVFLHELSHALATLATGGRVISLSLSPLQGGEVIAAGGNRFVALSAGYLGSLLLGLLLLWAALRTRIDRAVLALCGGVMAVITLLYVRDGFALVFCTLAATGLFGVARYLGHTASGLVLRVIGLSSMIYVPYDIFSDTIARSNLQSDARMLAEEIGGTTMLWGGVWLLVSLLLIAFAARYILGTSSNIPLREHPRPTP